jgi:MFS family permease
MTPEMAAISAFALKDDPEAFGPASTAAQCSALMTMATTLAGVLGPVTTGAIQANSGWIATSVSIGVFAALGLVSLFFKWGYDGIVERKSSVENTARDSAGGRDRDGGRRGLKFSLMRKYTTRNAKVNILKLLASFPTSQRNAWPCIVISLIFSSVSGADCLKDCHRSSIFFVSELFEISNRLYCKSSRTERIIDKSPHYILSGMARHSFLFCSIAFCDPASN